MRLRRSTAFVETWGVKYDKAVECLIKDREALLAFYDFPAEHWKHLRTTNVIEGSFATVRHRSPTNAGKKWGPLSPQWRNSPPVRRSRSSLKMVNLSRSGSVSLILHRQNASGFFAGACAGTLPPPLR